jgi:hypothetical protein
MNGATVIMPDGSPFKFWDDQTIYTRIYHVSCSHPAASDAGPGTAEQPFATISRAAQVLQPGEKVVVHGGIYRECVRPAQGGKGVDQMIAYEAAPGETVIVRGSEVWSPAFERGSGWSYVSAPVWVGDLPADWFIGYNPFAMRNFSAEYTTFVNNWSKEENRTFLLRRGMLFADGKPLRQVYYPHELADSDATFWVEDPGLRLHLRLPDDVDPNTATLEATAREQVFAPLKPGLGYIRVSGFIFEHAADGFPIPQRAMLSTYRGHHWIIERNTLRWANASGIDVGNETWHRRGEENPATSGGYIIRGNHVAQCGICGIEAVGNNANSLVEDNLIEHIGTHHIERLWENGGLKFHTCDSVLIRHNIICHIQDAPGIWLDYLNRNSRISGNVLYDIASIQGGIFVEVSHAANLVDHNLLWDVRGIYLATEPSGIINVDSGEQCVVAHNLLGSTRGPYAVSMHLGQGGRVVEGRVGLCRRQKVLNNLFFDCPKRILFARAADNQSDGNLFSKADDDVSLCVVYPSPESKLNLAAWQEYFGFDVHGAQLLMQASFDPEKLELTLEISGQIPQALPVEALHGEKAPGTPGPFTLQEGRQILKFLAGPK